VAQGLLLLLLGMHVETDTVLHCLLLLVNLLLLLLLLHPVRSRVYPSL